MPAVREKSALSINHIVLSGTAYSLPEIRFSPAGIPIARFLLEHRSEQEEVGLKRAAFCRVLTIACGEELARILKSVQVGTPLKVVGFLNRAVSRKHTYQLVIHAKSIDVLPS